MKRVIGALALLGLVILSAVLVTRSFRRHIEANVKPGTYSVSAQAPVTNFTVHVNGLQATIVK